MTLAIEDYALIGDCQTAALVGCDGSIDWLCLPRFDSPACFAALLGTPANGRWKLAPIERVRSTRRRYLTDTAVLETVFETDSGQVVVTDFLAVRDSLPMLARIVEGKHGRVDLRSELVVRFDYGSFQPWIRPDETGLCAIAGPDALRFRAPVTSRCDDATVVADMTVAQGERRAFQLVWHPSHEPPPASMDPERALLDTVAWWSRWTSKCTYAGPWKEAVVRSLITLKALIYMPTGGVVAAPTTSLPEQLGGPRNWDYRYCWLRDATLSLSALLAVGYLDEARAWRDWLLRAVAGAPDSTQILYGLAGERRLPEIELDWLSGYAGSCPVRIGNAASRQFQLDVYGEVLDALFQARKHGMAPADAAWHLERELASFVAAAWDRPDDGIWEMRGPRRHFTHSKIMAWVALDRHIRSAERFGLPGPLDELRRVRAAIHEEVCRRGFDAPRNTFVCAYGSPHLDASLLMIPSVGFLPASDPRVKGTVAAIEQHLMHDGLVLRYDTTTAQDGLPPGEGVFLACSFWLVDNLVLQGRDVEARRLFERLLALRNDVGLLSEEYDPDHRRLVGNFPQALTHMALINSALNLSRERGPAHERHAD